MSREPVISVESVSKGFRLQTRRATTIKAAVLDLLQRAPAESYRALQDVSFEVYEGETVGIIGSNGSGKSTVLKLITGIMKPTSGRVTVRGRISPLIELGAGFHPEFTGRENVFLNGALLGVPRKVLEASFDDIVAFSGIGEFIDQPVKTYSSGMFTRLGFSIAVHVDPDILVVDEVLSVGDEAFQKKCLERVQQFRDAGKTILFVAHNQRTLAAICDRVIWLEKGVKRMEGPTEEVLGAYADVDKLARGAPPVKVEAVEVLSETGHPVTLAASGERIVVRFQWRAATDGTFGWSFGIRRVKDTTMLVGANGPTQQVLAGETGICSFTTTLAPLLNDEYVLAVRATHQGEVIPLSGNRTRLQIASAWQGPAVWHAEGQWSLEPFPALNEAAGGMLPM